MAKIGLISCVSLKQNQQAKAENLYISPLFKKSRDFATGRLDKYFILSAKHGLLEPTSEIGPYDLTLNKMSLSERKKWADKVFKELLNKVNKNDKIIFLAGENYREFLKEKLELRGNHTKSPLYKMSIGEQLQWYSFYSKNKDRIKDLDLMYSYVQRLNQGLSGGVKLGDTDGKMKWPNRGVYLFMENNEFRKTDPFESRIVRVGTHAVSQGSKSGLWNRLRTHRGAVDLSGNHRGSIFRLHVGNSYLYKNELLSDTWSKGQTASKEIKTVEKPIEVEVSKIIGNMKILWLSINDKPNKFSDRGFIEKNMVALLSTFNHKTDTASKDWLGNWNPHVHIKESSLWNVDYVENDYDPRFLEIFEKYVDVTLGVIPTPIDSVVPEEWITNPINKNPQMKLFK